MVVSDSTTSGGKVLRVRSNGAASRTSSHPVQKLSCEHGAQYQVAPPMEARTEVFVDGMLVMLTLVSSDGATTQQARKKVSARTLYDTRSPTTTVQGLQP